MTIGSRAQVYHGGADKTAGGLRKKDLYKNKRGRIVSLKKSKTAKNWNPLKMMGLLSKSGEPFGARTMKRSKGSIRNFFKNKKTQIKRFGKKLSAYSRKRFKRGGSSLSYSNYPGDVPDVSSGRDVNSAQNAALRPTGGKRGGMTPLNQAYAPSANNIELGVNNPLMRSLNASI